MKAVNVDDVLKILHKYGKYIFVTDEKRYSSMVDEIANLKPLSQETVTEFADRCRECGAHYGRLLNQKSGHWIVDGSVDCYLDKVRCHCSECGKKKEFPADYDHIKQELSISYKYPEFIDKFCPNCGAKMVEISESEE